MSCYATSFTINTKVLEGMFLYFRFYSKGRGLFIVCMFLIYKTDVQKNGFVKCFRALLYISYVSLRVVDHYQ